MIKYIEKDEFKKEVEESQGIVLVDFFATWCGPCKMLGEVLEEMSKNHTEIQIIKIDVDKNTELAVDNGVSVVPTLLIVKNGKIMQTMEGYRTEEELLKEIEKYK